MNLEDLTTMVRDILDEPEEGFFKDDEIKRWLNEAQKDMSLKIRHLRDTVFLKTQKGVEKYRLPDDFIDEYRVFLEDDKLEKILMEEKRGKKEGYFIWEDYIIISPMPNDGQRLELYYFKSPSLMEDKEDEPEIPTPLEEYLTYYTAHRAKQKDMKVDQAQVFYEQYMMGVQEGIRNYSKVPRKKQIGVIR